MSKKELLINLANIVKDFKINLNENDILNLLKIEKRWPRYYPWDIGKTGKYTVGLISNLGENIGAFLYSPNSYLDYEKWYNLYNLGYTTILSHVLDLTDELRQLEKLLLENLGDKVNANFYFSKPGQKPSFDEHSHFYDVIVKQIYGNVTWSVNGRIIILKPQETLYIPIGAKHAVIDKNEKKLSLTINIGVNHLNDT
jgi:quercetin dioxygenase-like cupin family protein